MEATISCVSSTVSSLPASSLGACSLDGAPLGAVDGVAAWSEEENGKNFMEVMGAWIGHSQALVLEEVKHWSNVQVTGKAWQGLIARWAFQVRFLVEQLPLNGKCWWEKDKIHAEKIKEFVEEFLMDRVFNMMKEVVFFQNAKCIIVSEAQGHDAEVNDHLDRGEPIRKSEEHGDVGLSCQPNQVSCLRGGARGVVEQEDGWVVIQRSKSKPVEQQKSKKSYYRNVKLNLAGMTALGSAEEDCASRDSLRSEVDENEEELRGGAGGSAATARKRQVTEAVAQMESILQGLQTQETSGPDDVDELLQSFKELLTGWESKKPSKDEVRKQINSLLTKLKSSAAASDEQPKKPSARQSFYTEFHKKAMEKAEEKAQDKNSKGKGKGKGKSKTKSKEAEGLPKYDLRQAFPTMAVNSWINVMREIEEGREPSGSVTICPSLSKMSELQALSMAHGLSKGILLIAKADSKEAEITIKGCKKALLPYQGNLALVGAILAMSTGEVPAFDGTTPVKAVAINKSLSKENNVTLRVMVVKDVLTPSDLKKMNADPTYALHLLECEKKMEELKTSGWSDQTEAFVGYLELDKDKAGDVLQLSGKGGVFISSLRKNVIQWPNVSWRLPEKDESMVKYHLRIYQHARQLGKPMAFRRGGGAAFGIVMPETEEEAKEHSWSLTGAPIGWGPVTLREWLEKQGWSILDCNQPRWKTKPWTFRGRMAGQIESRAFAYEIQENETTFYIHITRWEKRRRADGEAKPMGGALWWSKLKSYVDEDPIEDVDEKGSGQSVTQTWPDSAVNPTALDASADGEGADAEMKDENGKVKEAPSGGSPPKKRAKQEKKPDVDKVVGGMAGPEANGKKTTVIDTGGQGNCGWRSLAFAVASLNNPTASDETLIDKLGTLATTMQARVTTYLVNHRREWEESWAWETKTSELMENGPIPTTIEEYCKAVKRPLRWMDGLLLATSAVVQRINIVVWTKKGGEWTRLAILKSGSEWKKSPTVPLILSKGHYVTLRRIKSHWPREWVTEEEEDGLHCSQGIDTQIMELNPLLYRGGMWATPKGKTTKRKQAKGKDTDGDAEELLRSCSSCTSQSNTLENDLLRSCSSMGSAQTFSDSSAPRRRKKRYIDVENDRVVTVNKNQKEWTCPVCQTVLNVAKGDSIDRRIIQRHVQFGHPDVWEENRADNAKFGKIRSNLGLRQLTWPVPFESFAKHEIDQKAAFICPYCEKCLPKINPELTRKKRKYLTRLSKEVHLKQCDKAPAGVSLKECHKLLQRSSEISTLWRVVRPNPWTGITTSWTEHLREVTSPLL